MSLSITKVRCQNCLHVWEIFGSDLDVAFDRCPKCGSHHIRVISRH